MIFKISSNQTHSTLGNASRHRGACDGVSIAGMDILRVLLGEGRVWEDTYPPSHSRESTDILPHLPPFGGQKEKI